MKIRPVLWEHGRVSTNCILIPCFEEEKIKVPEHFEKAFAEEILRVAKSSKFKGKKKESVSIYPKELRQKQVILWGLGKSKDLTTKKIRNFGGKIIKHIGKLNIDEFSIYLPQWTNENVELKDVSSLLTEGIILGNYKFKKFKSEEDCEKCKKEISDVLFILDKDIPEIKSKISSAEIYAESVVMGRDLVSHPANHMTPSILSQKAENVAKKHGLSCKIWDRKKIESKKMGAFMGIAEGSEEEPKFIILEYIPELENVPTVVLVGKGVTFDSGGISLKPSNNMDKMKTDMGGASVVIASIVAAARLKLPIHIVTLVPAAENMPSGKACKPGDVIMSMSGKSIEVLNTDAEGRLLLADALHHAKSYKPDAIIDFATLTGACMVALGLDIIGIMGNNEKVIEQVKASSDNTDEMVWQLPINEEFRKELKSKVADLKNIGSRYGGAITAGAFLSYFVDEIPWVHCDIAGPTWTDKETPISPIGATGAGIRMLIDFLKNFSLSP